MAATASLNRLIIGIKHLSRRIVASYFLDWILIIAIAAAGGSVSKAEGYHHAFSLNDLSISYPHTPGTVSAVTLFLVTIISPGVIIFLVCMIFVPGLTAAEGTSTALKWRRKVWECNTGWMGLALSLAGALFFTESLKTLTGKPRPDFLARCDPEPNLVSQYTVSGLGAQLEGAPVLVDYRVCRNQSPDVLKDGFAAWPSGHASFSWAGLLYLTLFLCAKFAISIPYLPPSRFSRDQLPSLADLRQHGQGHGEHANPDYGGQVPVRNQSAAPPIYLLILAFIPIGTAVFISASRWFDYRHAGFDIISGSLIGAVLAWFSFRWYHLPIRAGAGWAWGARSRNRAFYTGLGVPTYVGEEGWNSAKFAATQRTNLESHGSDILSVRWPDHVSTRLESQPQLQMTQMPSAMNGDKNTDLERQTSGSSTRLDSNLKSLPNLPR